jgi:hypothetical protein
LNVLEDLRVVLAEVEHRHELAGEVTKRVNHGSAADLFVAVVEMKWRMEELHIDLIVRLIVRFAEG